jgi:X-Pro dipeptidyl-peptidase
MIPPKNDISVSIISQFVSCAKYEPPRLVKVDFFDKMESAYLRSIGGRKSFEETMVRFNHFSIVETTYDKQLAELRSLGFQDWSHLTEKEILESWLTSAPVDQTRLQATADSNLQDFLLADKPLTWNIFYCLALQLKDFLVNFDYHPADSLDFAQKINLPFVKSVASQEMTRQRLISAIYYLLVSRGKNGMTLVEKWVSEGLLPVDNTFHFFNDKSLATFDTARLKREVVYVETAVDTLDRGQYDLVKVQILRPDTALLLPAVMTASPYHLGTNEQAGSRKLHEMAGRLTEPS